MSDKRFTVETVGLTTGYRGKHGKVIVTRNLDARLNSGELTCLLGPNGAGKSTLLKTLSGFLPPLSGSILYDGRPLKDFNDNEFARRVGIVLTERHNLENMTVERLVGLGRAPYTGFWGRLDSGDRRVVDEAMDFVGISAMRHRMVPTLSDGERQKAMIAKALAQETPVIFLDEPTAFLDFPSKVEVMRLLHTLSRTKSKTIFLSTHDLDLALDLADRIWLVDKGKDTETGTPEDLALSGALRSFFLREGIGFDDRTGHFRLEFPTDADIIVRGESVASAMVAKALRRNRMRAVAEGPAAAEVIAAPGRYEFAGHTFPTIGLLVENLKDAITKG